MATFISNKLTVTLEAPREPYRRADIEFHGIDHSRASYEGRLFFDHPDAGPETPTDDDNRYAGSFWVFGHGGCAGDEGHCEVPVVYRPFDLRPEHQLTPTSKTRDCHGEAQKHGEGRPRIHSHRRPLHATRERGAVT